VKFKVNIILQQNSEKYSEKNNFESNKDIESIFNSISLKRDKYVIALK